MAGPSDFVRYNFPLKLGEHCFCGAAGGSTDITVYDMVDLEQTKAGTFCCGREDCVLAIEPKNIDPSVLQLESLLGEDLQPIFSPSRLLLLLLPPLHTGPLEQVSLVFETPSPPDFSPISSTGPLFPTPSPPPSSENAEAISSGANPCSGPDPTTAPPPSPPHPPTISPRRLRRCPTPSPPPRNRSRGSPKRRSSAWSPEEQESCIRWMRAIHPTHTGPVDLLWPKIATRMEERDNFERTPASIRNMWNRQLREQSGYDERKTPKANKRTCLLPSQQGR